MASYPTSVKTFAARANGQTIDQSWFNDLQDEVTAVEDGLLNGTGPLNSSRSTVVSLSVTGNSTLAAVNAGASTLASLSVTGASTFASRPVMPLPDFALVYAESTGAIGSSASSTLVFTGQAVLTNSSMHSTGSNPDRLNPQSTGIYQVAAQFVTAGGGGATILAIHIVDSSGTAIASQGEQGITNIASLNCVGYKRFDAIGGHVKLLYASAGSSASISTGASATWFSLRKLA